MESDDGAAAPAPAATTQADVLPEVAEALGAMLQQLSVIQGAATDAERDAGYDALAGMLDEVQKKQPPPAEAPPPAEPRRPRPLTRQYSNASTYSPGLARQPPVPVSTNTRVYDEFVASMPSQAGKTAFVTGSNTGLGFFAAKALAKRGATVVLLCRSVEKAEAAKREMVAEVGEDGPPSKRRTSTFLASVRECAATLRARQAKCHMLLLNAGLMAVHHDWTEDGHDVQLQVNHLGHSSSRTSRCRCWSPPALPGAARVVSHASTLTTRLALLRRHRRRARRRRLPRAAARAGGVGARRELLGATASRSCATSSSPPVAACRKRRRRDRDGGASPAAFSQLVQVPPAPTRSGTTCRAGTATCHGEGRRAQSCADGSTPLLLAATDADAVGGAYFGPRSTSSARWCATSSAGMATTR